MTAVYSIVIGLAVVVAMVVLLLVGILRAQAEILRRLDVLGIRLDSSDVAAPIHLQQAARDLSPSKDLAGVDPDGGKVVVSLTVGDDPVLLAFLSTTCTSCSEFWEALDSDSMKFHESRYRVIAVTLGPEEESPTRAQKLARAGLPVLMSSEAWSAFDVPGAPYFAVVEPGAGGIIGQGTAATMEALVRFLGDAAGDRRWDETHGTVRDRSGEDRERTIDDELRRAGILPGDPRLHHRPGDTGDG